MDKNLKTKIETLITKAKKGDTDAFGKMYDILMPYIYRYVRSKTSENIAEDLTEEIFYKSWENLYKYEKLKNCNFTSWLYRIAHNIIIDYYRNNEYIEELNDLESEDNLYRDIEIQFDIVRLKHFISKLSKTIQEAVILKFIHDLNYTEIADAMKKTEGAVRVLVHRGISQLKKMVKK